jgi:hypothetical protein
LANAHSMASRSFKINGCKAWFHNRIFSQSSIPIPPYSDGVKRIYLGAASKWGSIGVEAK